MPYTDSNIVLLFLSVSHIAVLCLKVKKIVALGGVYVEHLTMTLSARGPGPAGDSSPDVHYRLIPHALARPVRFFLLSCRRLSDTLTVWFSND